MFPIIRFDPNIKTWNVYAKLRVILNICTRGVSEALKDFFRVARERLALLYDALHPFVGENFRCLISIQRPSILFEMV